MNTTIRIENITKRFRNTVALDRTSFEIPSGEIFGLLGPNGAGKTTLMRILVGILGPDEGTIYIPGHSDRRLKERIGYLPEERGLYPKMKVQPLLRYFAAIKGVPNKIALARIREQLERVGLTGQENRKVEELSKGNQQRVQLLMTLLHQPDFLILDEPFSGLDPIGTQQMKQILIEETQRGATVIISTHRMEDAEELCPHIALINKGHVIRSGSLTQIKEEEGHNELMVKYEGEIGRVNEIPGMVLTGSENHTLQLTLSNETSIPAVVRALAERIDIHGVTRTEPTLNDIFIRLVNQENNRS